MKHKHHIIPKHMGGTDDPINLIKLTVFEHAEAHRVLFEKHGHWQDELAWKALSGQIGKEEIMKTAQLAGITNWKMNITPEVRSRMGAPKGRKLALQHGKKIGKANSNRSPEVISGISKKMKGNNNRIKNRSELQ